MKRQFILLSTVILSALLAGLYGIIHDQFTYTICHEYFTRFKFFQFGLAADQGTEAILPNPRLSVAIVGFMATWWTGVIVGIGNGLTGLLQKDNNIMVAVIIRATLITITITIISGLAGLLYGELYLSKTGVNWWLPNNLTDKKGFISVGSMHNFSYLGGVIGLLAGIGYQVFTTIKNKKSTKSTVQLS